MVDGQYRLTNGARVKPQATRAKRVSAAMTTAQPTESRIADEHFGTLYPPADRDLAADAGGAGLRYRRLRRYCRSRHCRMSIFPTITVSASYPGASPATMASAIATPLEQQFAAIPSLDQMTST